MESRRLSFPNLFEHRSKFSDLHSRQTSPASHAQCFEERRLVDYRAGVRVGLAITAFLFLELNFEHVITLEFARH